MPCKASKYYVTSSWMLLVVVALGYGCGEVEKKIKKEKETADLVTGA